MGLAHSEIDDLVLLTQNNLVKRGAFTGLQTDLTDFVAVREIWKNRQKKFAGGDNWEFQAQMDHNHSARTVGLFETDGSSVIDTMKKGEVAVRHLNAHYIYDLREKDFQRGGHAIVDLIKTRYVAMKMSWFELLEEILWSKPEDSSDIKTPYGIPFWVVKNATEGFNGGNPAGFADGAAGISSTEYPRWRNYTGVYAAVSKEDLIRKMRKAHTVTRFRSPVSHATPDVGKMANGIYAGYAVIGPMEEQLEKQNMSLGNDVASKDGKTLFKGTPLTYVPKLDDDSTDPIYMLDWNVLACGVMEGWEDNLSKPEPVPGKHNVRRVDLDASLNTICTNRRRQTVFSKAV